MRKSALVLLVSVIAASSVVIHAAGGGPAWAAPGATALKKVGAVPVGPQEPNFLSNLDCTELTYRLVAGSEMHSGCFTPTAFGLLDSDSDTVIFNGTDEGLPLLAHSPHQVLAPWPKALNLVTLDAANTGGSYIGMYRNPLASIRDERDWKGALTAKKLTAGPDISLKDTQGRPLIINPQTMAYSEGGSWLAVETLGGSFIRLNLASLGQLAFAPAFGAAGSPGALLKSQVAISADGRFVAISNEPADSLKVYDLRGCGGDICPAHEYRHFISQRIGGLQSIRHLRFINDGLLSFEAFTGSGNNAVYELAPTADINYLTDYLGLGDSYTSGEGAFDYLPGTDTADNTCHLSVNSYPLLLTRDLFGAAGGHSLACSGAVIDDIGGAGDAYAGQVQHGTALAELQTAQPNRLAQILSGYLPGYIPQELFVRQYQPRVATVSIGGNDIGFGDILEKCVVPRLSRHLSDETCYNTYESRQEVVDLVNRTIPRWTALFRQLQASSPGTTFYAIGYPSVVADTGDCPLNVNLGKGELEFAEELIHYLDGAIKQAAAAAGVPYVDISRALVGHRLCEATGNGVAVNGLTAGNDFGVLGIGLLGRESYHPNALGHQLIEQAILRGTDNLSLKASPPPASAPEPGGLLDAPKSGRTINRLVPDSITGRSARPGTSIAIRINGARDGLTPAASYTVRLDGPPGPVLGQIASGPDGGISGSVTIPDGAPTDVYAIDVIGPGQDGQPVDVSQPLYITDRYDYESGGQVSSGQLERPGESGPTAEITATVRAGTLGDPPKKHVARLAPGPARNAASRLPVHILGAAARVIPDKAGRQAAAAAIPLAFFAVLAALAIYLLTNLKSAGNYFGRLLNNRAKMNYENLRWWFTIVIMRKFGVAVFSVFLFASLLVLAFSTSSNLTLTNQQKVEKWLSDSNVYGAFVESAIDQADQTAGTDQSGGVSLSDAAVKQAAESSFSSKVLKKDVHAFLTSNYAWLNGKVDKPAFNVDLTDAKQNFAGRVGDYVTAYLKGLPACGAAQSAKIDLQTTDPLTLDCRPAKLDPEKTGDQITQQLAESTEFLSDPVLTADNFNPGNNMDSADQPYYQQLSGLPGVYQKATKIPFVAAVVVLFSLAAIIAIIARKRNSLKIFAIIFGLAGLVMVSTKLVSDQAFRQLEKHAFNASTVGELQKALTVFFHRVEDQLVKVDLWFGIVYLLICLVLILALVLTRQKGLRIPKRLQAAGPPAEPAAPPAPNLPQTPETPALRPASRPPRPKPPQRPKPPRLIQ